MIDVIKATYPQTDTNGCLQTLTDKLFFVFDTEQKRCIVHADTSSKKHFTVENPTGRNIHFLAIDKCLFSDEVRLKRCDFAVFDGKTFCFVEVKETAKDGQRSEYNREAKAQLKATILHFQEQLEFTTKRIEAYICVGDQSPRPARRTNDISERFDFELLGVELYRGNIKRFA